MKCITAALCLLASTTTRAYAQSSLEAGQERELGLLSNDCKEKDVCNQDYCICKFKQDCDGFTYFPEDCGPGTPWDVTFNKCTDIVWSTCCEEYGYCVTSSPTPAPTEEKTDVDCVCSPRKYAVTTNDYKGIDPVAETCSINAVNLQDLCKTNPLEIDSGVPGIKTNTELVTLPIEGRSAMCNVCTTELNSLSGNCDPITEDEKALSIIWTGIEALHECVEYKDEVELEADGIISGLGSLTDNIVSAYKGGCGKSLAAFKKGETFESGTAVTLNTALSDNLVSGTCIDEQRTMDVARAATITLTGKYLTSNAESFKSVTLSLYWEYTNCCADGIPFSEPVVFWPELFGGTPLLTIGREVLPDDEWCSATADDCKSGGRSDSCGTTQDVPFGVRGMM